MARLDMSVIILSHNTREDLRGCLDSIEASAAGLSCEVIVIDNGSTDGSAEMVSSEYPEARLIRNETNLGYARAANQGLRAMDGRYALMLNSDVALSADCLERLVRFMDANQKVGAASPLLCKSDGSPRSTAAAPPSVLTEVLNKSLLKFLAPARYPGKKFEGRDAVQVDTLVGACIALRWKALLEVGFYDEGFFFYLEDTDLCLRLRSSGWKVCVLPDLKVYHRGGASASAKGVSARVEYYVSLRRFFEKHRSKTSKVLLLQGLGLKLAANLVSSFIAATVGLYLSAGRRARLAVNARLLWWFLRGMPAGWGLAQRRGDASGRAALALRGDEKILIIKQSSMGDIVHALPALAALRRSFAEGRISWSVEKVFAQILEGNHHLDRVFILDTRSKRGKLSSIAKLVELCKHASSLRRQRFDVVVDFQGLMKTSLLGYLSGAKIRVGFEEPREPVSWLYTHKAKIDGPDVHAVDRYMRLLSALGVQDGPRRFFVARSSFNWSSVRKFLSSVSKNADQIVVIHPSAGKKANIWPEDYYCELAERIVEDFGAAVILTGSRADAPMLRRMESKLKGMAVNAAGKFTLGQLGELLRGADLFIGGDTGPLHLAVAVSCKVVALFGPASPKRTGPYMHMDCVVAAETDCAPCYKWKCKSHECMKSITVDKVYGRVRKAIDGRDRPAAQLAGLEGFGFDR